jgi:hypothetical protein
MPHALLGRYPLWKFKLAIVRSIVRAATGALSVA